MKIAVYTIAKNEEQFVKRWAESCADADYRLILDTGSTDKTTTIAWDSGVTTHIQIFDPWRFDHARNAALSLLPHDIDLCIALDMDEVLQPGWREAIEAQPLPTNARLRYKYVWSWNEDGSEGLTYGGDKIHARHNFYWKHPVHEVIKCTETETQYWTDSLQIHHHPDSSKSRSQYLPLLKMAVEEDPRDDRNQFYLAREYYFNGETGLAQYHFSEHLKLSMWHPERAASYRYLAKMRPDAREHHLYLAIAEDPLRRESWADLAKHYYAKEDWDRCLHASRQGLLISEKPLDYLCEAEAWGPLLHDLAAISLHHLGDSDEAFFQGSIALSLSPADLRLQANLDHYRL
jgi:hypothetical protein